MLQSRHTAQSRGTLVCKIKSWAVKAKATRVNHNLYSLKFVDRRDKSLSRVYCVVDFKILKQRIESGVVETIADESVEDFRLPSGEVGAIALDAKSVFTV